MKKLGMISMVLVLCLAVIGAGYAKWTSSVHIDGIVETGNVEIGIVDIGVDDLGPNYLQGGEIFPDPSMPEQEGTADPQAGQITVHGIDYYFHNTEGKNVGSIESINPTTTPLFTKKYGQITHQPFYSSTSFVLNNAYPGYAPSETILLASNGSVPVKIQDIDFTCTSGGAGLEEFIMIGAWSITLPDGSVLTGNGHADILNALAGIQLHFCNTIEIEVQFIIVEENAAGIICPQDTNATITVDVIAVQWNEYV